VPTSTKPKSSNKTRWGDREGRRRDILDAAREQMATGGYLALNMRDLARRASVSPGTLYQYFSTKEEIFATLYAEAIEAHNRELEVICADPSDLERLLVDVSDAYLDQYASYGRYFTMWAALPADDRTSDTPLPLDLAEALRDAAFNQGELIIGGLRRVAPRGRGRLLDQPIAMTFVWSVLNGLGDHLTSERRHLTPFSDEELVTFAARTLAAGLLAPAPPRSGW
jgi:AcrR family transcriptional regulator